MSDMLAGVIGQAPGRPAALPRPAAGKTGTTQEYRDAWFIGYTADLVAGVWLGNDDNSPMNRVTGGAPPPLSPGQFFIGAAKNGPPQPVARAAGATKNPPPPAPGPGLPRPP